MAEATPLTITNNISIMKQTTTEKEAQRRKRYSEDGTRGQKMMSFRLDNELSTWLDQQDNKGRYINELIAADMSKHRGKH